MKDFNNIKSNGKVFKLKVGELVRFETDISHYYWLNERFIPGVSSILSEASPTGYGLKLFWQNNTKEEADEIFNTAGEFGSLMHEAFEALLKGEELNLLRDYPREREKKTILSFMDWFKEYEPKEFESEQSIASSRYSYAGTLDFVGIIKDERWLIDFKTTSGIHYTHQLQVLAYKQAYEESTGLKIDKVGIARFGTKHKAGYEFKEVTDYTIEDFMNLYRTYLSLNGGSIKEPKTIAIYPETVKLLETL